MLVSVLLILALATVLVVATSMVAQVERTAAANALATERARANALFALDVALDQLQTAAGPDQRVSARADILEGGGATLTQPYWTGVWKSHNPANPNNYELDVGNDAIRPWSYNEEGPTWLVSQTDLSNPAQPATFNGTTTGDDPTAVRMATFSVNGSTTEVRVPRVPLMDTAETNQTTTGAYAYWIQDEGIKAKVNLVPNEASNDPSNPVRYVAPATTAAELALEGDWQTAMRNLLGGDSTKLAKVKNPAMLDLVLEGDFSGADDGLVASSPDITTHSFGVLSDTRKGGLKTDLTAAFEDFSQFETLFDRPIPGRDEATDPDDGLKGKLWRVPGVEMHNQSQNMRDGIRWAPFWMHYNLYKNTLPVGESVTTTVSQYQTSLGGDINNSIDTRLLSLIKDDITYTDLARLRPAILGISSGYYFSTYSRGGGSAGIRIHYSPKIVLGNPHNVAIEIGDWIYGFTHNLITSIRIHKNGDLTTQVDLPAHKPEDEHRTTGQDSNGDGINDLEFRVHNQNIEIASGGHTLLPGEIKVFGFKKPQADANMSRPEDFASSSGDALEPLGVDELETNKYFDITDYYLNEDLANFTSSIQDQREFLENLQISDQISITFLKGISNSVNFLGIGTVYFSLNFDGTGEALIENQSVGSFLGPANGPGTHMATLFFRVKGRSPLQPPAVPLLGYAGSFYNSLLVPKSTYLWDTRLLLAPGSDETVEIQRDGSGGTYWGQYDVGAQPCETEVILREIPTQPLTSLGQLKNANAYLYTRGSDNQNRFLGSLVPVGNSWPNPEIASQTTPDQETLSHSIAGQGAGLISVDDVFLNNEALFDKFYFSTVPPAARESNTEYPTQWGDEADDHNQSNVDNRDPLLNPRLKYHLQTGNSIIEIADLRDMDKAAANLLVDGAFNVNSTSVPAWRALLGSLRFANGDADRNPVPRIVSTLAQAASESPSEDYSQGLRVLDASLLDALAQEIVDQVERRGPFLTMADFVNRRRVTGDLGENGALQAAIDESEINDDAYTALGQNTDPLNTFTGQDILFPQFHENKPAKGPNRYFVGGITPAVPDNTAEGAPGVITQADLLQPLAPILTTRSDTFAIRVFGEAGVTTPRGTYRVEGQAYGEAIVQRVPEFVDQSDPALSANNSTLGKEAGNATPLDAVNDINQSLGRRFKVVSFRWLNPEEI